MQLHYYRRFKQFSVRLLFLTVTCAAIGSAWSSRQLSAIGAQRSAIQRIRQLGGEIYYDMPGYDVTPLVPTWFGQLHDYWFDVHAEDNGRDKISAVLSVRVHEKEAIQHVSAFPYLLELDISGSGMSDADLETLKSLQELVYLRIDSNEIRGLKHVARLRKLYYLNCDNTMIDDAAIMSLSAANNLCVLSVRNTRVTAPGAAKLAKSLPQCAITR